MMAVRGKFRWISTCVAIIALTGQPAAGFDNLDTSMSPADVSRIMDRECGVFADRAQPQVESIGIAWADISAATEQILRDNVPVSRIQQLLNEAEVSVSQGKPIQTELSELQICILGNKLATAEQREKNRLAQQRTNSGGGGGSANSPSRANNSPNVASSNPGGPASLDAADNFSRCITVRAYPRDGGIQQLWAMRNGCLFTVIVRYCFSASVEAAGDPNLCTRREYRTHEIRSGGTLDFAFSPVPEGTAMSDGTMAGPNGLTVFGYACGDGRFPQVYFEGKRFLTRGC